MSHEQTEQSEELRKRLENLPEFARILLKFAWERKLLDGEFEKGTEGLKR